MTLCMQITQRNTVSMAVMLRQQSHKRGKERLTEIFKAKQNTNQTHLPLALQRSRYETFFVKSRGLIFPLVVAHCQRRVRSMVGGSGS